MVGTIIHSYLLLTKKILPFIRTSELRLRLIVPAFASFLRITYS